MRCVLRFGSWPAWSVRDIALASAHNAIAVITITEMALPTSENSWWKTVFSTATFAGRSGLAFLKKKTGNSYSTAKS
jgi:hypothetical protein